MEPLDRLMGAETEYALRYEAHGERPSHLTLYQHIRQHVARRVALRRAAGLAGQAQERYFLGNGGSLYYEFQPLAPDHGLVEAGTPECRGPSQVLRYMRAQDHLLLDAVQAADRRLPGTLGLIRNGRDGFGHVYGPQENYDCRFASGWRLWLWRAVMVPAVAWSFVAAALHWAVLIVAMMIGIPLLMLPLIAPAVLLSNEDEAARHLNRATQRMLAVATTLERWLMYALFGGVVWWSSWWIRQLGWHPQRRGTRAFLATRMVLTGAGSVREDGFHLSEKADAIRRETRLSIEPEDRGFYEIGHVLKLLLAPMVARPRRVLHLFRDRQRLQFGMADANMCDMAAWLCFGTTCLVLDLIDSGDELPDPPDLDPVTAAQAVSEGGIHTVVATTHGEKTAVQVQRFYLDAVDAWLQARTTVPLEATELVKAWRRCLDGLADDPEGLVGQIDWVTKRSLLEEAGDLTHEERLKAGLRYHELGGTHAWLVEAGLATQLVSDEDIAVATQEAPDGPAAARARWIRDTPPDVPLYVDWTEARIGSGVSARVIQFPSGRRKRGDDGDG
jgi:proteasome accessory factor A